MSSENNEDIKKIVDEFSTNYLSKYRWEKDAINNLSAEDFLTTKLVEYKKKLRKRHFSEMVIIADDVEKKGWTLDRFIKTLLALIDLKL